MFASQHGNFAFVSEQEVHNPNPSIAVLACNVHEAIRPRNKLQRFIIGFETSVLLPDRLSRSPGRARLAIAEILSACGHLAFAPTPSMRCDHPASRLLPRRELRTRWSFLAFPAAS